MCPSQNEGVLGSKRLTPERDDEIVNIFSKVKQRLQSLKKNVKKMSPQTKEKHSLNFSSTTVNLAPMNIQELIKSVCYGVFS